MGVGGFDSHESSPTPQSKLRGHALVSKYFKQAFFSVSALYEIAETIKLSEAMTSLHVVDSWEGHYTTYLAREAEQAAAAAAAAASGQPPPADRLGPSQRASGHSSGQVTI